MEVTILDLLMFRSLLLPKYKLNGAEPNRAFRFLAPNAWNKLQFEFQLHAPVLTFLENIVGIIFRIQDILKKKKKLSQSYGKKSFTSVSTMQHAAKPHTEVNCYK